MRNLDVSNDCSPISTGGSMPPPPPPTRLPRRDARTGLPIPSIQLRGGRASVTSVAGRPRLTRRTDS